MSLNTRGEHLGQLNVVLSDRGDEQGEGGHDRESAPRFRRYPRPRRQVRQAFVLQPEDAGRSRPLRRQSRTAPRLLARPGQRAFGSVPGLVDVRSSLEAGNPELQVVFNRDKLASLGLDMGVAVRDAQESRPGCRADAVQGGRPADRHPDPQRRGQPRLARRRPEPRAARSGRPADPPDVGGRRASRPRTGRDPPPAAAARRGDNGQPPGAQPRRRGEGHRQADSTRRRHRRDSSPSWADRTARCRCPSPASVSRWRWRSSSSTS